MPRLMMSALVGAYNPDVAASSAACMASVRRTLTGCVYSMWISVKQLLTGVNGFAIYDVWTVIHDPRLGGNQGRRH